MEHMADEDSKLVKTCTLPLTGAGVVNKIITDLAEFEFRDGRLHLTILAPGVTVDEIHAKTEAAFTVSLS
jgi:3-oxoacid CoA-transferase subunit B